MTSAMRTGCLLAATFFVGVSSVDAQSCMGLPSVRQTPRVLSTTGTGTGPERLLVMRMGLNRERFFGGASAGYKSTRSAFSDPNVFVAGFDFGYSLRLQALRGVELCPLLQNTFEHFPTEPSNIERAVTSSFGLAIGRPLSIDRKFGLTPFTQVMMTNRRETFSQNSVYENGELIDRTGHFSRNKLIGQSTVGLSFRFGEAFTISPAMTVPFGFGPQSEFNYPTFGREPNFSLSASFGLGKRR